jgi:hypothetical protein
MRKAISTIVLLFGLIGAAADSPVERWANAVGGRERVAAITSIYREATIEYAQWHGTLKVWHTADGKYRKVEEIGGLSTVVTFDGVSGAIKRGDGPPHAMTLAEFALSTSQRFANANAMLFAFFPERFGGTVAVENDNTVVLKPAGGVEWRVLLDPQTALPKAMVHNEGDHVITVTLASYEAIDGIMFEKEIRRSADALPDAAVIRFTKTVINGPADASLFSQPA